MRLSRARVQRPTRQKEHRLVESNVRRAFFSRLEIIFPFFFLSIFYFSFVRSSTNGVWDKSLVACLADLIPFILYLFTCVPTHLFNGCTLSSDKHTNESEYRNKCVCRRIARAHKKKPQQQRLIIFFCHSDKIGHLQIKQFGWANMEKRAFTFRLAPAN